MKKIFLAIMVCSVVCAVCAAKGAKKAKKQKVEQTKTEQQKIESQKPQKKTPQKTVQVVNQECVNLSKTESVWLPGLVQDKIKSNLQEYLDMRTVVDSKSETALKKLQAESESAARDEATAIELGKISTAKFGLFVKVRKTGSGYAISADYTDLTTGEQLASVTSKEYTRAEYLYGSTGAVDEITLALAGKIGIALSDISKNFLANGSAAFTVDEQLVLAKQNEEQYKKLMSQYDDELAKLSVSNDLSAVENKRKIEAEKALLIEKQNSERKRQEELRAQKEREVADARLEAERSIAVKTQRDKMAKDAAAKAAEVRKLKIAKQGVFGQINIIESKKKVLVEIRNSVEARCQELFDQLREDRADAEEKIRNKPYDTVELGTDGQPTDAAKERRERQIIKSYQDLTNKFFDDCDAVKASALPQDAALLAEISTDQKSLTATRTVSSMGEELKVGFDSYNSEENGWKTKISLYSEGELVYTDDVIVSYAALSGKKVPDMKKELNDAVIQEYSNNVDMYNSLLTRGDPIVYFELDYVVNACGDDKPSEYMFNFNRIRMIDTVTGKIVQTTFLDVKLPRKMKPEYDLRIFAGIEEKEKAKFDSEKYFVEKYMTKGEDRGAAEKHAARIRGVRKEFANYAMMVKIPGCNIEMMTTEVTQALWKWVMGDNPSYFTGVNNPVENISFSDAFLFCNKLSEKLGFEPTYVDYMPDLKADGFRLPSIEEWKCSAKASSMLFYNISEHYVDHQIKKIIRYDPSSVAQKKTNEYGLYDMTGNVVEWVWEGDEFLSKYICDGDCAFRMLIDTGSKYIGFRIVRTIK